MNSSSENPLIEAARRQAADARRCAATQAGLRDAAQSPFDASVGWSEYELLGEICRGGQGVVYRAMQRSTQRVVALKVLRESPLALARDRARFEREVQILAAVSHPNVVTIHDSGARDGWRYYVMDYIDGQPLDQFVDGRDWGGPRRRIEGILALLAKVCEAVHAAHLHGVIHRDLKPGNILVDRAGEPHVVDFGLARSVHPEGQAAEQPTMTQTGQFVGTLPFASPEQAAGLSTGVDVRTDVYSLGVVLYQLLTGRFPYDVRGPIRDVLNEIVQTPPRRPRDWAREIDDDLETILLKCLEKEPGRRYQSAGELARDLRRRLAGEPIDAKRDSMLYLLRKRVRRHRAGLAAGGVLLTLLAASTVGFRALYLEQAEAHRRADRAADEARSRFREARAAAEFLMDDVAARLNTLLGATELRKTLLDDAYERFESLARDSDDPEVMTDQARLHAKLAKLARELGRSDDAQQHCDAAVSIVERLQAGQPGDSTWVSLRAELSMLQGDLALWRSDVPRAEREYGVVLETYERLCAAAPDDADLLRRLSLACERRALLAAARRDSAADLSWSRRMLELKQAIVRQKPTDATARYELSVAHERIGRRESGATALAHIEEALRIREDLVQQAPEDGRFLRALSISYEQMAMQAHSRGDDAEDRQWTQRMAELKRRMIAVEPQNFLYQHDYAISLDRLADQARSDDPAQALALNAEALEIFRRLATGDPASVRFAEDLVYSLDAVARSARAARDLNLARSRWEEALARLTPSSTLGPRDAIGRLRRVRILCNLAEVEREAGQAEAMLHYSAAARPEVEALLEVEQVRAKAQELKDRLDALLP